MLSEEYRIPSRHNQVPVKILAIGNSWTENATDDLGRIFDNLGYKVLLTRTYLGDGSLMDYSKNLSTSDSILVFSVWDNGKWVKDDEKICLKDIMLKNEWDIITLQQNSRNSCTYNTYQPYLNKLLNYIYSLDIIPVVYYHVTWSYPVHTVQGRFPSDTLNSSSMYEAVIKTWSKICEKTNISKVILSAPVIQQCREIDGLDIGRFDTEDGLHLFHGKYAAACAWASSIINTYFDPSVRNSDIIDCTYYGPYPEDIAKEIQATAYEVTHNIGKYIDLK